MLIASLVVAMADAGRADEGSQREWMLQGEEVRGVGDLPSHVVCEKVETAVDDGTELRFTLRNDGMSEAVIEEGDYGFLFPFDSVFQCGRKNADRDACVAHVWCGGDVAWVWAGHPNGERRYYSAVLTQGNLASYSIHCDASRAKTGAFYRGSPVLNPPRLLLPPKGIASFVFRVREPARRPDRDLMGPFLVTADNYSPFVGEEVSVRIATPQTCRELGRDTAKAFRAFFAEREGFACIDGICPRLAMSNDEDECGTATSGARTTDSVRLYELEKP